MSHLQYLLDQCCLPKCVCGALPRYSKPASLANDFTLQATKRTAKLGLNDTTQYNTTQYNEGNSTSWYQTPCMQSEMELWLQDQKNIYSGWGCVFLSIEPFGSTESRFVGRQTGRQAGSWLEGYLSQVLKKHLAHIGVKWHDEDEDWANEEQTRGKRQPEMIQIHSHTFVSSQSSEN